MSNDRFANVDASAASPSARQYVVVARRYRPQAFAELVGQEHVAQALSNAISSGRVGHAYLFTGARGVGKTSAARILAKALNCQKGASPVPCNQCDICRSISGGEDVDVLEIDGASNRGIDEIRQLRQNVNVRPSRARFKIYIIDEVHMLTREAFNALLKTLEEPPEHVKFIFCTTEPTKIPITILSRCQRFDFAGIVSTSIAERLQQIVAAEGVEAEPAALETIARRAAGSMRDSQSLLEQLLSFSPGRITLADVHRMLGTAGDESLSGLLDSLVCRDPAAALRALDEALGRGVDVSQLLEQLLGYLRDCMAAAAGCPPASLLYCSPTSRDQTIQAGKRLGLNTAIAAMQILDQALSRMRFTTQGRVVAELALVRISQLADLEELSEVIGRLEAGIDLSVPGGESSATATPSASSRQTPLVPQPAAPDSPPTAAKKKETELSPESPDSESPPPSPTATACTLTAEHAVAAWSQAVAQLSGMLGEHARQFHRVELVEANRILVCFRPRYAVAKSYCQRPEQVTHIEQALSAVVGQKIRVDFAVEEDTLDQGTPLATRSITPQQRMLEVMQEPMIRRAEALFGAQVVRVDDPANRK